ncbi:MAG: Xaa-Pro peptidase family protein [Verrucomicrobiae bacterium]|nr:Xaa-Pro peptidase family protein [Verrucomicrobiae bacterium]MCX7721819.1 Xaa-Pro peptidase family protein [Verrucomicrobiae bacterium]MDW7979621.1 Xaa-Pro peptidase family protein [Verrucomicrobiales bacterium]
MPTKSKTLLIVADSERDPDMLYAVGMFAPDPFIYLCAKGRRYVAVTDLEYDRARDQIRGCTILRLSQYLERLRQQGLKNPKLAHVIAQMMRERGLRHAVVPGSFPCGLAAELKQLGITVRPKRGAFFPERELKSPDEVKKITAALVMAEVGLAEAIQVLKRAKVGRGKTLYYNAIPLTAERLRGVIESAIAQANGQACRTIVACGKQACNPHEPGHGVLRANEPIIIDVFPRSQKTGYYGDITRTVVKGHAPESVRKLYDTVRRAQQIAFEKIRPGVRMCEVHRAVQEFFEQQGYKTHRRDGHMQGFFHGTGHGVGLEIHEPPRINAYSADRFKPGHVVTVEPGLYYLDIGGVRLEDVVLVTRNGLRNLTRFEKVLEI